MLNISVMCIHNLLNIIFPCCTRKKESLNKKQNEHSKLKTIKTMQDIYKYRKNRRHNCLNSEEEFYEYSIFNNTLADMQIQKYKVQSYAIKIPYKYIIPSKKIYLNKPSLHILDLNYVNIYSSVGKK